MSRIESILRNLFNIWRLGGGSFWRGLAFFVFGAVAVLSAIALLPALVLALLPDWLVTFVQLLLNLAILGGVVYVGAISYRKIKSLLRSR